MNSKQIGLLAAFQEAGVEYVIVGGVAVIAHGYVRTTHDLDVFIRPSTENAQAAFRALQKVGAPLAQLEPNDLLCDYENLRFGPPEDHIDILPDIGGVSFDEAWRNRVVANVENLQIPFISKQDLIRCKEYVGRSRDLNDIEELEALPDDSFCSPGLTS